MPRVFAVGIKRSNRNLGPPNLHTQLQKMNDTVPIALEASNADLQTQILVPAIVSWVLIGYLWFWHRSTKVWVRCNGNINAFTNVPELTQRTRITAICLASIVFLGVWPIDVLGCIVCRVLHADNNEQGLQKTLPITRSQHELPPPPYDSGGARSAS
ncbi:hypothetical protein NEUTE1DRAFT_110354 [Neurospora tetrasperma FGSC 2508]|uniref:Uncharacterized protein n=1 Tax=Neurospora tetrasperma (strain FGSC 2508 / ATCC MYA-4615 / P0657) TaxID=510951 RepID=F8MKD3_NEUT8|nr:uncharacterized protein NEUTE1DRAFT_110354 [Neurospora tetrasperma FGSC 2508]EGO58214.1 hypothetical protein NEUTE1DRAFT_110354 [Neurospora tetrasperma FGSC 2508]EGZ71470.1 hypothetical protein NEUTE2DRAFT_138662 [Neurospora tetrasperma FGSC 2509]